MNSIKFCVARKAVLALCIYVLANFQLFFQCSQSQGAASCTLSSPFVVSVDNQAQPSAAQIVSAINDVALSLARWR
jgi:hypothetical protein